MTGTSCPTCGKPFVHGFQIDDYLIENKARPLEMVILRLLAEQQGPLTIPEIAVKVYGHQSEGGPLFAHNCLYNSISRIRRLLRPEWQIKNIRLYGYWLQRTGEDATLQ